MEGRSAADADVQFGAFVVESFPGIVVAAVFAVSHQLDVEASASSHLVEDERGSPRAFTTGLLFRSSGCSFNLLSLAGVARFLR